jgi:fucose permease
MAFPMAWVLERTGYKNGMAWGLAIMAVGSLLFIPAALSQSFTIFLLGLFTMGTGLTILQTASNPYVIHLGDVKSAAMRISIMGIINKGAGVIAPLVFTALILADLQTYDTTALTPDQINALAHQMIMPYIVMAMILLALIGLIKFAHIPDLDFEEESGEKNKYLSLSSCCFRCYRYLFLCWC